MEDRPAKIPPLWGIVLMLAVGITVPFMFAAGERHSGELSPTLARERLKAYDPTGVNASPDGAIYVRRPAFFWAADAAAAEYELTLRYGEGDTVWLGPVRVQETRFLLPAPGDLEIGVPYRFVVHGLDADGQRTGSERAGAFAVKAAPNKLADLQVEARGSSNSAEMALAMAGVYTQKGTLHDVASSLIAALREGLDEPDRRLAESTLRRLRLE